MKTASGLVFRVKVKTRSSHPEVEVVGPGELCVRVKAPPEKGWANKEVCQLLAAYFGLTQKEVEIISGAAAPTKLVYVAAKEPPPRKSGGNK